MSALSDTAQIWHAEQTVDRRRRNMSLFTVWPAHHRGPAAMRVTIRVPAFSGYVASIGKLRAVLGRAVSPGGRDWLVDGVRRQVRRKLTYARAAMHRQRLPGVTFVGVTGSAGKTTTKDLITLILSGFGPCQSTFLSENEHLYIAQTVLATRKEKHRFCVVEASGAVPGYMDRIVRLVKPQIAVLTLIARDHFQASKRDVAGNVPQERSRAHPTSEGNLDETRGIS